MLSNSQVLFEKLAQTLYRAGFFVSFADDTGGKKARVREIHALYYLMHILQQQHSEEEFIREIAKIAEGEMDGIKNLENLSAQDIAAIERDLQSVPTELENAVLEALENFEKHEARLYADLVIAAGASVGKAYDEKDDFVPMDLAVENLFMFLANIEPIFNRVLGFFNQIHQGDTARYLYDENSLFDQMKISGLEAEALGKLAAAVKAAWAKKYPEDLEQSVEDFIKQSET